LAVPAQIEQVGSPEMSNHWKLEAKIKGFFFLGRTRFRIHGAFRPKMWKISPQNWSFKPLTDWEPTRG
jgi:hypothetical protein